MAPTPSEAPLAPLTEAQKSPRHTGFHVSIGLGGATLSDVNEPGLLTQFKLGYGFSEHVRIYYYALNDWYAQSWNSSSPTGGLMELNSETRIAFINGLGVDYFFLPAVGLRLALGVGGDAIFSRSTDDTQQASDSVFGVAYTFGLTFDFLDGANHLFIDPVINIVNVDANKFTKAEFRANPDATEWKAVSVIGITLGYSYH